MPDQKIPEELKQALLKRKVIPFVGTGVSMAVQNKEGAPLFPGWRELLERAATKLRRDGKSAEADAVNKLIESSFLKAAEQARKGMGLHTWYRFLKTHFDINKSDANPASLELARMTWKLGGNLIITTNYDRVLRWVSPHLEDLKEWDIKAPVDQVATMKNDDASHVIWHLHGTIARPDNIILTSDGYEKLYPSKDIESIYESAVRTLEHYLLSKTLVFIGCGFQDSKLTGFIKHISAVFAGAPGPHFLLVPASEAEEARKNVSGSSVEVIDYESAGGSLIDYLEKLKRYVPQSAARSPVSDKIPTTITANHLTVELTNQNIRSFTESLSNPPKDKAMLYLETVRDVGIETHDNEDKYIDIRKTFFSSLGNESTKLFDYIQGHRTITTNLSDCLMAYEFGRAFTENRRAREGYDILSLLEGPINNIGAGLPPAVRAKMLDGIGEAARFCGMPDQAIRLYQAAEKLNHKNYFVLKHIGTIYRIKNEFGKAEHYFKQAIREFESYHVIFSLGYLYHDSGRYKDALKYYERCMQILEQRGVTDFYRVSLKAGYIHMIRGQMDQSFECLFNAISIADNIERNYGQIDSFLRVSRFAAQLLLALTHPNESQRFYCIDKCRDYLQSTIDSIDREVFYCVYNDIVRVLAARSDLMLTDGKAINSILASLHQKHVQFSIQEPLAGCQYFNTTRDCLSVLAVFNDDPELTDTHWRGSLATFETSHKLHDNKNAFCLTRTVIGNKNDGLCSIGKDLDTLIDHGGVSVQWLDDTLKHGFDMKDVIQFTALVPQSLQELWFPNHLYLDIVSSGENKRRVFSQKALVLDPVSKNRVFINPTVGCSLKCNYCYLIEYGISNNLTPISPVGVPGSDYARAIERLPEFRKGKDGALLSIGSFCEPFLLEVRLQTIDIMKAVVHWKNPLQVVTKEWPGTECLESLCELFQGCPGQLTVYLSMGDLSTQATDIALKWLNYSDRLSMVVYIKPFLTRTVEYLEEYSKIGNDHKNVSFAVGSFYSGKRIDCKLEPNQFDYRLFQKDDELTQPGVQDPVTSGVKHINQLSFEKELAIMIDRPIFRTASCALSVNYGIKDPLQNYKSNRCIKERCPNQSKCFTE